MELLGKVAGGVIVPQSDVRLPEGAMVRVVYEVPAAGDRSVEAEIECAPGQLPVVRGGVPGSVNLTNDRIHEILDAEDVEAIKSQWNAPS